MTNLKQDDRQIAHFCELGTGYEEFLYLAAQPLLFSTDLLYKLWLNFRAYQHKMPKKQASYIVVSDLILSGICEAIGADLFCIAEEKRKKLSVLLDPATRKKVAFFIEQYALQNKSKIGENIYNIHTLWAKSVYDAQEMERIIIEKLKTSNNDYQKVNYLSLYFKTLSTDSDSKGLEKANISLEFTEDVSDPYILKYVPKELEERIRNSEILEEFQKQSIYEKPNEIIAIEKLLDVVLKRVSTSEVIYYTPKSFQVNKNGELVGLNLSSCEISDIKFLKSSRQLSNLILNSNHITNIQPLENLLNLVVLSLENNNITSIKTLFQTKKINYLNLNHNQLKSFPLELLDKLNKLEYLYLRGNSIINFPKHIYNSKKSCLALIKKYSYNIKLQNQKETEAKLLLSEAEAYEKQSKIDLAKSKYLEALKIYRNLEGLNFKSYLNANGSVLSKLGDLYALEKDYSEAINCYQEVNLIYKRLDRLESSKLTFSKSLINSCSKLGEFHSYLNDWEKSLKYFEEEKELYEKKLNEDSSTNVGFKNGLAISYEKLGSTHNRLGSIDKALKYFEEGTELYKELYDTFPSNVGFKNGLAIAYSKLGETHSGLGNLEKALKFFEYYNILVKELYVAYPQNVSFKNDLAIAYSKLGETHSNLGNLEHALKFFKNQAELFEELYNAYPSFNPSLKNNLAISYSKLGETYRNLGILEKALFFFKKYNHLEKELYNFYPQNKTYKKHVAISYYNLSNVYFSLKNMDKALDFVDKSIDIEPHNLSSEALKEKILFRQKKPTNQEIDEFLKLASQITETSSPKEVKNYFSIFREKFIRIENNIEDIVFSAEDYFVVGLSYFYNREYEKALEYFEKAVQQDYNKKEEVYTRIAACHFKLKNDKSIYYKFIDKSLRENEEYASAWYNKGVFLKKDEKYVEAIEAFQKAIEIDENHFMAKNSLGTTFIQLKDYKEAINIFEELIDFNPNYYTGYFNLACACAMWATSEINDKLQKELLEKVYENLKKSFKDPVNITDALHDSDLAILNDEKSIYYKDFKEFIDANS